MLSVQFISSIVDHDHSDCFLKSSVVRIRSHYIELCCIKNMDWRLTIIDREQWWWINTDKWTETELNWAFWNTSNIDKPQTIIMCIVFLEPSRTGGTTRWWSPRIYHLWCFVGDHSHQFCLMCLMCCKQMILWHSDTTFPFINLLTMNMIHYPQAVLGTWQTTLSRQQTWKQKCKQPKR